MSGLLDEVQRPVGRLRARRQVWLMGHALRMVWTSARRDFLLVAIGAVIVGAGAAAQVAITNSALADVLGGGTAEASAVGYLLVLVGVIALVKFITSYQSERERVVGELVARHAQIRVLDVAAASRLESFDDPDFYNRLERATMTAEMRPLQLASGLLGAISAGLAAIGVLITLVTISPVLGALLTISVIPLWMSTARSNRALYAFNYEMTHLDRTRAYLGFLITGREAAAELRASQATPFLRGHIDDMYDQRISAVRSMTRQRIGVLSVGNFANALAVGAVMLTAAYFVDNGLLTVAQAGAAFVAIILVNQHLVMASESVLQLHESILFVDDLVTFVDRQPTTNHDDTERTNEPPFAEITLHDVDFQYPSGASNTLQGINLSIKSGEIIALVGENGSGKTTLAKVIAGLYSATGGTVAWDGDPLTPDTAPRRREHIGAVLQDFIQYRLSVADNIAMGRARRRDDNDAIRDAAARARAHDLIESLPDGYDTQLGSQFLGGLELSGGQWQRLALARAFFRDAELLILDEPTSALDPRAERELFDDIRHLCKGRTVLLISHRFANVRTADRIYVLASGCISESGTHDELMARDGRYAELFRFQAAGYRNDLNASTSMTTDAPRPRRKQ